MTTSKAHHQPPKPVQWFKCHPMAVYLLCLLLLLILLAAVSRMQRNDLVIPDEKAAAANLLGKQLTGPRYFQIPDGDLRDGNGVTVKSATEPHITSAAAKSQVDGIVRERKLSADKKVKVLALIDLLAETPSSRLVGADHINLLRLNLAIDAL